MKKVIKVAPIGSVNWKFDKLTGKIFDDDKHIGFGYKKGNKIIAKLNFEKDEKNT